MRSLSSAIFRWESWCQRFGGRVLGSGQPDDEEFIIIKLDRPL
jgi:hypothetical protein